jgi:hypothetical protein
VEATIRRFRCRNRARIWQSRSPRQTCSGKTAGREASSHIGIGQPKSADGGFQKALGLSPPSSPNLLSLVTPITSGAHSRRCAFPVHFVLPNRRRVTYSNLCTFICVGEPIHPVLVGRKLLFRATVTFDVRSARRACALTLGKDSLPTAVARLLGSSSTEFHIS